MPDLPKTLALLQQGLTANHWPGFSLAAFSQEKLYAIAGGDVPSPTSSVRWYSAGKPIIALGVLQILEKNPELGSLPMENIFPEWARTYVGSLTLESILTHRTGLRCTNLDLCAPEAETLQTLARSHPKDFQLVPGQAAYDPRGGWWILQHWIQRHAQQPWQSFLHDSVLRPAGLDSMFFATADRDAEVSMSEWQRNQWVSTPPSSGRGNLCASAIELARFYQILLSVGLTPSSQTPLFSQASFKKLTHRWRQGEKDATFGHIIDFGLGVILDSNRYGAATVPYGFGTHSSETAFGHGGARSSIAFADPTHHLAVAICLNGQVSESRHQPRIRTILDCLRSELA